MGKERSGAGWHLEFQKRRRTQQRQLRRSGFGGMKRIRDCQEGQREECPSQTEWTAILNEDDLALGLVLVTEALKGASK